MIYVDCTLTFRTNGHTGIERMVRGIVKGLAAAGRAQKVECAAVVFDPCRGFVPLAPIAIERRFGSLGPTGAEPAAGLRTKVRRVLAKLKLLAAARVAGALWRQMWWLACRVLRPFARGGVSFAPGDVLVLLDVAWDAPYWADLGQARSNGAKIGLCVIDLIMLNHPECVEPQHTEKFQTWFDRVAAASDFFVCISQATWREVAEYHARHPFGGDARRRLVGDSFRLGADLDRMAGNIDVRAQLRTLFEHPAREKIYLQVGLISPRKNHALALEAFEKLWSSGASVALVIVGRMGWSCDAIIERIRTHEEFGRRLFWFEHVGDDELDYCYRHATSLLTASYAEGFNLPIVEALSRGTTVIATDIPAHREVGGEYAAYFPAHDVAALVALIRRQDADGTLPQVAQPAGFRWPDWDESCIEFVKTVGELSARHDAPHAEKTYLRLSA